jgi:hypothetical protein
MRLTSWSPCHMNFVNTCTYITCTCFTCTYICEYMNIYYFETSFLSLPWVTRPASEGGQFGWWAQPASGRSRACSQSWPKNSGSKCEVYQKSILFIILSRYVFGETRMVRGLSQWPNLTEGPAATWDSRLKRRKKKKERPGLNVMILKIFFFCQKIGEKMAFLTQNKAKLCKKFIITSSPGFNITNLRFGCRLYDNF